MIIKYLTELLYDNECVIVPNFGAFITKNHSAVIDYVNNRFVPPYKEIVFNDKLANKDDLLLNFICQKDNISQQDAAVVIQDFVNKSKAILEVKGELDLPLIGKIKISPVGDYIFEEHKDINFLGDSFALTEFNCQPIFRSETYQLIKEQIYVEQQKKYDAQSDSEIVSENHNVNKNRRYFKSLMYTSMAFLLIFMINWGSDRCDSNLASWNPLLYSSPNEFIINMLDARDVAEENEAIEISEPEVLALEQKMDDCEEELDQVTVEDIEQVEVIVEQEILEIEQEVIPAIVSYHYFIVGGSFQTEQSAEKCLQIIKNQGFDNASVLEKNDKGYIRVFYESFAEKDDALVRLEIIKKEFNESAWLLFQK